MTEVDMSRLLFLVLTLAPSFAAGPPPVIPLWPGGAPGASLTAYIPAKESSTGAAAVIAAGGKEGHDIAKGLAKIGVAGVVLESRPAKAIEDAQRALRLIRSRAREWNVDRTR